MISIQRTTAAEMLWSSSAKDYHYSIEYRKISEMNRTQMYLGQR